MSQWVMVARNGIEKFDLAGFKDRFQLIKVNSFGRTTNTLVRQVLVFDELIDTIVGWLLY